MRQFRNQEAIAEAIAELFIAHGACLVEHGGGFFAVFFDDDLSCPMPVGKIDIGKLAAQLWERLS
ncbi:hypothetical protein SAMN05892877_10927 [Rhizobium subbaraonis]|uniref:Uncharacterized protein n=1 Tax=Rhizobium subbaraonis TaxID=908946 RepID=A0A285UIH9_9HYPH|nr:hypothetical protein [Rhizobium subbaraonis]SOC41612.1 hypothetical protein SAMN05892877_10927 [Rhizobium subbaraonis]